MTRPTDGHTRRCQHYAKSPATIAMLRCPKPATHRFLVNGVHSPHAGYTCLEHGQMVCAEYAKISAEIGVWTLEEIPNE